MFEEIVVFVWEVKVMATYVCFVSPAVKLWIWYCRMESVDEG